MGDSVATTDMQTLTSTCVPHTSSIAIAIAIAIAIRNSQVLTLVGYLHICYQPYFTHIINSALTKNPKMLRMYIPILRLCLVGGTMLFARYFFSGSAEEHFPEVQDIDAATGTFHPPKHSWRPQACFS